MHGSDFKVDSFGKIGHRRTRRETATGMHADRTLKCLRRWLRLRIRNAC
ncbi:MAG: hypothetical protein RBR16_12325 [Syntrophus sp. (in: bacteria)]|nr:hypothetical protein [Syntrophus sp. (in: bacteria)]